MTSWTELPLAAFDLETTSPDPHTARIVTACVLRIDGGDVTRRHWVANPGVPIPAEATEIHGYTDEYVSKHGRPHDDVVAEVVTELQAVWQEGRALAVYNGSYDLTLLAAQDAEFTIGGLVVDPFVLDKQYDRFRKGSRKLSAVMIHYGMRLDDAHDAEADALAAARLAWKLPRTFPHLAEFTADELMERQTHWYREEAHRFRDYLRRNDRDHSGVRTQWPIQATNPESEAA
ncbi:exonuclease domain-containing protein [Nocardia ignorata]|uniref:DNA polymerase-3 subunit alpha/DNA polymerase-3 subunit epsilon n=1 Tax=Nocardia ignorata TaxID=145285 RepID=A0A4R6NZX5_NOCIG|nr:exonuclease domain-containing protein [Nocardia ignorata]TDP29897.1 DNA polymerase-3 subunit alpha/DNA polymerase-3 subunit epsilon [Nocardia ignorata]